MRSTLATLCALLLIGGCERRPGPEAGAALDWQPVPPALPPGAHVAVLEGDGAQPGPFRFRLDMPDGYEARPHYHPVSETIEVLEGTFLHGRGREWDEARLKPLVAGEVADLPAGEPHFVRTRGRTVIEVRTSGPFGMTHVNPADHPQAKASH